MKIQLLPTEERLALGATHRIQLFAEDLTEAAVATAQVIKLLDLGVGSLVRNVYLVNHQPFQNSADPAFNTTTVTVGDGGTANKFVTSTETNANGVVVRTKAGTGTQAAYDAAAALNVTVSAMAAKALASLDTGELWVFAEIIDVSTYDGGNI